MASKGANERVYALHDFDAENPDEVSFKAGETIVVVEKDDAYGDGWWQGTNPRGETGLFPFSYTTYDRDQATSMADAMYSFENDEASREANGKGVKATIDDIDNALARMKGGRDDASGDMSVGGDTDEITDGEDDYEKRAKARAALAVNAAKKYDAQDDSDRAEQARLKQQAMRVFEQEEEKHRMLLLQKEEERKRAAAQGVLPTDEKPKEAPIPGVDMSDESDSEESHTGGLETSTTHAPLFAAGAGAAGASAVVAGGLAAATTTSSASKDVQQQNRQLSPIESDTVHAKSTEAKPAKTQNAYNGFNRIDKRETAGSLDDRSVDSARVQDSPAPGRSNNAGTSIGTAPTSFAGSETPKSGGHAPHSSAVQQSPAPSTTGSRPGGPGGDPHEWTVDQVVEWGRSKGWDEAAVVSKFAEHEISGDVLMEMDVNILKEIEITAFGKRFQVANAIKDLKKSLQPTINEDVEAPTNNQWGTPMDSPSGSHQQQQSARSVSQPFDRTPEQPQTASALGPAFTGGAAVIPQRNASSSTAPPETTQFGQGAAPLMDKLDNDSMGRASSGAHATPEQGSYNDHGEYRSRNPSSGKDHSSFSPDSSIGLTNFNAQHATSPRKRESAGSSSKSPSDRQSFFAGLGGQKNRKPAPRVQSGGSANIDGEPKGTLSRLGFNRSKNSQGNDQSANSELRNKISLPTGSPTYDAMGDTARRHRLSHFGPATSNIAGFQGHQKQASMGSAGGGASDWHTPGGINEPRSPAGNAPEGAVMARIRPVDYEGWMRKKGERYNSWKPRYMALKGSDLVLLRDPTAPKIKGYVNMKGYKVIADENTNPGKYGFKILHETEKPHYFSSDDAIAVREWMKALMKATIGRDTSLPVISSYNNATISLKEAQRMNPPPRPPSPTSRARAQRAAARANKDQLTAKDASVLMGMQSPQERAMAISDKSFNSESKYSQDRSYGESTVEVKPPASTSQRALLAPPGWGRTKNDDSTDRSSTERIAPLNIKNVRKPAGLPVLDNGMESWQLIESHRFNAPIPSNDSKNLGVPTPPSKNEASSRGVAWPNFSSDSLAQLPPPPLPSHSPEHTVHLARISARFDPERGRLENWTMSQSHPDLGLRQAGTSSAMPPPPMSSGSLPAPPPISKESQRDAFENGKHKTLTKEREIASSINSYPTVASSEMPPALLSSPQIDSAPIDAERAKRISNVRSMYLSHQRPKSMADVLALASPGNAQNGNGEQMESLPGFLDHYRRDSQQSGNAEITHSNTRPSTANSQNPSSQWSISKFLKGGKGKVRNRRPSTAESLSGGDAGLQASRATLSAAQDVILFSAPQLQVHFNPPARDGRDSPRSGPTVKATDGVKSPSSILRREERSTYRQSLSADSVFDFMTRQNQEMQDQRATFEKDPFHRVQPRDQSQLYCSSKVLVPDSAGTSNNATSPNSNKTSSPNDRFLPSWLRPKRTNNRKRNSSLQFEKEFRLAEKEELGEGSFINEKRKANTLDSQRHDSTNDWRQVYGSPRSMDQLSPDVYSGSIDGSNEMGQMRSNNRQYPGKGKEKYSPASSSASRLPSIPPTPPSRSEPRQTFFRSRSQI